MKPDPHLVRVSIDTLVTSFRSNPLLYFNESDLQSELFAILLENFRSYDAVIKNRFVWGTDKPRVTRGVVTRRVHSELLLPEGRIDLAILDLEAVRLAFNSRGRFGHLQLQTGEHIFIELKASRTNRSGISSKHFWARRIKADLEKLASYNHQCFLLCFDFNRLLDNDSAKALVAERPQNVELMYFRDDIGDCYFEEGPNKALQPPSGAPEDCETKVGSRAARG